MSDWFHNLPLGWMTLVSFGGVYLVAFAIHAGVTAAATPERTKSFKLVSPGMLPPLGIIFGLFVAFTAAQVWNDNDRASSAVSREVSALRSVLVLAATFPGDFVTRMFASVEQIAAVPFRWSDTPLPGFANDLYRIRRLLLRPFRGTGAIFVVLAIAFLAAVELRLGLFALFFVLYFGGYPMLQFNVRHHFHLEVFTWWAIGFVLEQIVQRVRQTGLRGGVDPIWRTASSGVPLNWNRAGVMLAAVAVCAVATLWVARAYQQRAVAALFHQYIGAPREQERFGQIAPDVLYRLPLGYPPGTDPYPVDVVEVDTNTALCDPRSSVTFRYRDPRPELTHVVAIAGRSGDVGTVRVFEPVYESFEGVEFARSSSGCVTGVYRMSSPARLKVLLSARLQPGWEHSPLYQRRLGIRWAPQ